MTSLTAPTLQGVDRTVACIAMQGGGVECRGGHGTTGLLPKATVGQRRLQQLFVARLETQSVGKQREGVCVCVCVYKLTMSI